MKKKLIKKRNSSGKHPCCICGIASFLHAHHIEGRNIPNANKPSNLVSVCPNCHASIHHGEIIIEGWISTTEGLILMWHKKGEQSFTGRGAKPYLIP